MFSAMNFVGEKRPTSSSPRQRAKATAAKAQVTKQKENPHNPLHFSQGEGSSAFLLR